MNETITCHVDTTGGGVFRYGQPTWREPRPGDASEGPYGQPFRTCSYCGGMHPLDLLAAIKAGATLDVADWKYGWPHKVYVEGVPNPLAGQRVVMGSNTEGGVTTPIWGDAPRHAHGKFYNTHLADLDDAELAELAALMEPMTGVVWAFLDDNGTRRLGWRGHRPPGGVVR